MAGCRLDLRSRFPREVCRIQGFQVRDFSPVELRRCQRLCNAGRLRAGAHRGRSLSTTGATRRPEPAAAVTVPSPVAASPETNTPEDRRASRARRCPRKKCGQLLTHISPIAENRLRRSGCESCRSGIGTRTCCSEQIGFPKRILWHSMATIELLYGRARCREEAETRTPSCFACSTSLAMAAFSSSLRRQTMVGLTAFQRKSGAATSTAVFPGPMTHNLPRNPGNPASRIFSSS